MRAGENPKNRPRASRRSTCPQLQIIPFGINSRRIRVPHMVHFAGGKQPSTRQGAGCASPAARITGQASSRHFLPHGIRPRARARLAKKSLPAPDDRKRIGEDIKTVEFGWPVGMPVCKPLGDGIHEVRTGLSQNRIARVLFYIDKRGRMVLLHGFIKKKQATRVNDMNLARSNKRKHERGLDEA